MSDMPLPPGVLDFGCMCFIISIGVQDISSEVVQDESEVFPDACRGVGVCASGSRGVMGVLEGAVVRVSAFPPYSQAVIAVVVRVLPIEVDVVVLHLSGGSFWQRLPRGHVVQFHAQ